MMSLVTVSPVITAFHSCCLSHHVITGDTVTRLIIPIRGRGKNHLKKARGEIWPKRSERRNNTKNYQDEEKKSAINKKKLILRFIHVRNTDKI